MNVDIQAAAYFSDGVQGADQVCEIALNLKFTLEVLNSMLGSEITFQIGSPNHAVVLQEFHRTFLLMPVMINKPEPVSEREQVQYEESEDEGVDELEAEIEDVETEIEDVEAEIED
jgi:hypothetical protein